MTCTLNAIMEGRTYLLAMAKIIGKIIAGYMKVHVNEGGWFPSIPFSNQLTILCNTRKIFVYFNFPLVLLFTISVLH